MNLAIAAAVAVVTGLLSPETCTTTTGPSPNGAGQAVVEYRTCTPSFDAAATFILGLLVFVSATALELLLVVRRDLELKKSQAIIWRADELASAHLHNILFHTRQIISWSYGKHDRYVRYFMNEIVHLENRLREAAESKDLVVSSDEFQSPEDIQGAFRPDNRERVFKYTWPIDDSGPVFTTTGWRYFFDLTIRMVADGTLTGVKALLVIADAQILQASNVQRLLEFYATTADIEAKVVTRKDFGAIASRNDVPEDRVDFGIYNESLLYVTENANGRFTKDEFRIALYNRLFETIWRSSGVVIASSENLSTDQSLSLARLLELDREP